MANPMIALTRRNFLALLAAPARASLRSPNLVILAADGWRGPSLASRGDSYLIAPNLERLAGEAIEFTRAYTARPLPAAGDSPILTGNFPHRAGSAPALSDRTGPMGYVWGGFPEAPVERVTEFIRANRDKAFAVWRTRRLAKRPDPRFRHPYDGRPVPGRANMTGDHDDPFRREFPPYYAALTEADWELGRVLDVLEETGLSADTILIFTSHCGRMVGSHGLEGDDEFYEESASVPLFVRYPRRFQAAARLEFPVSLTDLTPTLLALCEADIPPSLPGRNLAPLLLGETGEQPQSIFVEGRLREAGSWRMVVRGVNKLVVDRRQQVMGLYNIGLDPYEMENQAADPTQELTRDEMRAILRGWISRTGDWATRPR